MLRNRRVLWAGFGICLLSLALVRSLSAQAPKTAAVSVKILNWEESLEIVKKNKGKIVVMDVWSTSCDPCMKEFPNLVKLHQAHGKDVACISVSTDYAGSKNKPPEYYRERVLKFLQEQEAGFDNVLLNVPSDELFEKIELSSIPAVYVFGRDGKLVKRFDSESAENLKTNEEAFTYADVNKVVQGLLKAKKK
ncbi:MAG: TlpA disulfide reductase family protein [Planctomycetota bacterium]